ncbi:MAG: GNAT family N-acetyltransferase [Bryobacterales bacterium]|nr:GNAT family N-acetyltransferase [Bryobacterales bacterium]
MSIRPMEKHDIPRVVELGRLMHQEGEYRFLPFDPNRCAALLERCFASPRQWCALVAETRGEVMGMLVACKTSYLFCAESVANDLVLYVAPQRRGGLAAAGLIRGFADWAARNGVREACLSTSLDAGNDRAERLIERLGFRRVGGVFKQRFEAAPQ